MNSSAAITWLDEATKIAARIPSVHYGTVGGVAFGRAVGGSSRVSRRQRELESTLQ